METWCGTNTETQRSDVTQCLPSSLVPFPVFFPLPVQTAGFDIPEHYPLVAAHYGRHVYIRPTPHLDNVCDRCATQTSTFCFSSIIRPTAVLLCRRRCLLLGMRTVSCSTFSAPRRASL